MVAGVGPIKGFAPVGQPGRLDVQKSMRAERSKFLLARGMRIAAVFALLLGTLVTTGDAKAGLLGHGEIALDNAMALDAAAPPSAAQPSHPGGTLEGLFSRPGAIGGFAAGFLGAGLVGLLFGHGLVSGLGSVASILGVLFQLALIVTLVRVIWTWWHEDKAVHSADLSPRQLADAYGRLRHGVLPDIHGGSAKGDSPSEREKQHLQ